MKYVDPKRGDELLKNLDEAADLYQTRREEFENHSKEVKGAQRTHWGEVPEVRLYNALKDRCAQKDESLAIFHGLNIHKFDPAETDEGEKGPFFNIFWGQFPGQFGGQFCKQFDSYLLFIAQTMGLKDFSVLLFLF